MPKKKCCRKYRKKGRACKSCPVMALLCKKERKILIKEAIAS